MMQYCRYCAFCFQADEDEFRCSEHPKGKQPHWTRKQINRRNNCPNYTYSDLGDAETGKAYRPRKETQGIKGEQVSMFTEVKVDGHQ